MKDSKAEQLLLAYWHFVNKPQSGQLWSIIAIWFKLYLFPIILLFAVIVVLRQMAKITPKITPVLDLWLSDDDVAICPLTTKGITKCLPLIVFATIWIALLISCEYYWIKYGTKAVLEHITLSGIYIQLVERIPIYVGMVPIAVFGAFVGAFVPIEYRIPMVIYIGIVGWLWLSATISNPFYPGPYDYVVGTIVLLLGAICQQPHSTGGNGQI